ncbi:hypothetical protein H1R20_g16455, partial [Candolleomyces eurysporus]
MPMAIRSVISPRSNRDLPLSPDPQDKHLMETDYSRKAKLLIELVNDLRKLGGNQFNLDIPCMAFIGNQSAGKSSVVEGATGTVYDPKQVEIWLKRAQAAILSPDTKPEEFHAKTSDDIKALRASMLPFSLNTIELLVRDPDGTDLCFVDLPGIIQHHPTNPAMVPFVKDLVTRHIKKKNTLIVVTIPMPDEIDNQEAFQIASQVDPKGLRTIGVGTKPDMVGSGSLSLQKTWKNILEGNEWKLKHGYYCVKMPDDRERQKNSTKREWEKIEADFFDKKEPWKSISDRSRFGMRNFVENTSKLLVALIETNLPTIQRTVDELLDSEKKKLKQLPPRALQGSILGTLDKDFIHRNQKRYGAFKGEIQRTAPALQASWRSGHEHAQDAIFLDDIRETIGSHLTWELPDYIPFDATKQFILQSVQHWEAPLLRCSSTIYQNTLGLVRALISKPEHFGRFAELDAFVRNIVEEESESCQDQASTVLKKIFDMENGVPLYTANLDVYHQERNKWLNSVNASHKPQWNDELKVMADIHAYFQVSSSRFIDYIVLCIEQEWHHKLVGRLQERLIERIPTLSREQLDAMLREDPEISARREIITQRIEQLTKIKARLLDYEKEAARNAWVVNKVTCAP